MGVRLLVADPASFLRSQQFSDNADHALSDLRH